MISKRWDIINYLISIHEYKTYLEIGVGKGTNFNKIHCGFKESIDPESNATYTKTSDKFFASNKKHYDIIFIDGLHINDQVDRDIKNSLGCLNDNGIIVIHDCNPPSEKHQLVPKQQSEWTGTVWKSFVKLRCTRQDLFMCVVDVDYGCGIIKKGKQKIYNKDSLETCLNYKYFNKHRKELLNLITVRDLRDASFLEDL